MGRFVDVAVRFFMGMNMDMDMDLDLDKNVDIIVGVVHNEATPVRRINENSEQNEVVAN